MTENEQRLQRLLSGISPLYEAPMREAKARQDALAKPPGSLGLLEEISIRLAGITGTVKNEAAPTRIYVLAADNGVDCAVDIYPHYGSDVEATLKAGCDIRHGLIGAGVYASHGYERSHVDGVWNTLKVLAGYLEADGVR